MVITDEMLREAAIKVDMAFINSFPPPKECQFDFSESFEKKMKKLFWRADHFVLYKTLKRAASFAVALFTAAAMLLTLNTNARAALLDWAQDFFDGLYHYFFVGQEELSDPKSYSLSWLPDGYNLVDSFDSVDGKTFIYFSESGEIMNFMYLYGLDDSTTVIGGGDYEEKLVSKENFQAKIYIALSPMESNGITWKSEDGNVMFNITGFLSEDELVQIAQSLIVDEIN